MAASFCVCSVTPSALCWKSFPVGFKAIRFKWIEEILEMFYFFLFSLSIFFVVVYFDDLYCFESWEWIKQIDCGLLWLFVFVCFFLFLPLVQLCWFVVCTWCVNNVLSVLWLTIFWLLFFSLLRFIVCKWLVVLFFKPIFGVPKSLSPAIVCWCCCFT